MAGVAGAAGPREGVTRNTVLIGLCFMCVYCAFNAVANTSELVTSSFSRQHPQLPHVSGYHALMLFNVLFALSTFLSPLAIRVLSDRVTLFVAGSLFVANVTSYMYPVAAALYTSSALAGVATTLLWGAGFNLITVSCRPEYMELNSTVFWLIAQCSYLFGNGVVFLTFFGVAEIEDETRYLTVSILATVAFLGVLLLCFTEPPSSQQPHAAAETLTHRFRNGCQISIDTLKESVELIQDCRVVAFLVIFLFTGICQSFFNGIYGTCIGRTLLFGREAKWLAGVSGIFVGLGQIAACFVRLLLQWKFDIDKKRPYIILLAASTFLLAFIQIFLFIPNESPIKETTAQSILYPNKIIAINCSFLLGFSDCLFETQILTFIGSYCSQATPSAMAMFSFFQGVGGMMAFFYTNYLTLYYQLSLMTLLMCLSAIVFMTVDHVTRKSGQLKYGGVRRDSNPLPAISFNIDGVFFSDANGASNP